MNRRVLGSSGIAVNPLGLGCMGFSHAYGAPMDKGDAMCAIRAAYDMGYDFFDTAECYVGTLPDGTNSINEELVGEALADVRDKVVIATKMGVAHNADRSLCVDSRPATIRSSLESSLRKLGTDYIDLYYQHRIDPKVDPEVVAETMAQLISEGKIRAWGISEADEDYLRRAHAVCPVAAIQNRYSMMARHHEVMFPVCGELSIAFVAYSPMANGVLTGAYSAESRFDGNTDYRASMPQYSNEGFKKAQKLIDLLEEIANGKGATPGQISLAWMLCKKPYIIPIPGSRRIERIKENLHAADVVLTQQEVGAIDKALAGMEFDVFGGHASK